MDLKSTFFDLKLELDVVSCVDVRNGFTKDDSDINWTPKKIMMRFYMFSNSLKSDFNFSFFILWILFFFHFSSSTIDRKLLFNGMLELNI